ncbi:peroxysomal citrate synthase [Moniliophthora roreri MCA 2997]|uniref:Peroxysomal citrate synthase n=1 Tax=Moniliophthora roreri (strain MCA 2997) TaxID=1381753 RepID=V2X0B4_MONRO|nr:peroxysomal citrate synthase [Moniliophthora roreri MCA 2997]
MDAYNTSSYGNSSSSRSYPYPHTHLGQVPGDGSAQQDVSAIHHQAPTIYADHGSSNSNTKYPYPTAVSYSPGSTVAPLVDERNGHGVHHAHTDYGVHDDQLVKRSGRRGSVNSGNSYPYPVPGRRTSQSDVNQNQPRPSRKHSITSQVGPSYILTNATGGPLGPSNHIILPQEAYHDDSYLPNQQLGGGFRRPPISFQVKGFPELGVRMSAILGEPDLPLVGGEDKVFKDGYKEIRMRLLWPGYSCFPFERRIKTCDSQLLRSHLLLALAKAIMSFLIHIPTNKTSVECGFEAYQIKMASGKPGFTGGELFITGLIHRGGPNWQPEIWYPIDMPQHKEAMNDLPHTPPILTITHLVVL